MNELEVKRKLLRRRTAKIGYVGQSICIRIKADALIDSGFSMGETIKMEGKPGSLVLKKLLPKEKKILGV